MCWESVRGVRVTGLLGTFAQYGGPGGTPPTLCAHSSAWTEVLGWEEECLRCVSQVRCRSTQGRKQSLADHTGFPPHDVLGGVRSRWKAEAPSGRSGLPDPPIRGERQDGACRLSFAYGAGGRAVPVPPPVPGVFGVPPALGPDGLGAGTVGRCT